MVDGLLVRLSIGPPTRGHGDAVGLHRRFAPILDDDTAIVDDRRAGPGQVDQSRRQGPPHGMANTVLSTPSCSNYRHCSYSEIVFGVSLRRLPLH